MCACVSLGWGGGGDGGVYFWVSAQERNFVSVNVCVRACLFACQCV